MKSFYQNTGFQTPGWVGNLNPDDILLGGVDARCLSWVVSISRCVEATRLILRSRALGAEQKPPAPVAAAGSDAEVDKDTAGAFRGHPVPALCRPAAGGCGGGQGGVVAPFSSLLHGYPFTNAVICTPERFQLFNTVVNRRCPW